jgi:membrane-associated phospholipid phosphatase
MFKTTIRNIDPFRDITSFGSLVFYGLLLFFTLSLQEFKLFYVLLFGLLVTFAVIIGIRLVYFKPRPSKQAYKNIIEKIDASSFPSLHAARVMFLALVGIFAYKTIYTTIFLLTLTIIILYSRTHLKKHDWIDLGAGAFLGLLTYWLATLIF